MKKNMFIRLNQQVSFSKNAIFTLINAFQAPMPFKSLAPEALSSKDRVFNEKTDVWAFGIVIWELMTGCTQTPDLGIARNTFKAQHEALVIYKKRLMLPDEYNPDYVTDVATPGKQLGKLVQQCWHIEPAQR